MKNILIINHYAGSPDMGMEFRPYYFAKEWIKAGYRVDIIAADYSHLRNENPIINKDFTEQVIDGIHYHWVHTIKYKSNGGKRAITMFQFVGKIFLNAKILAFKLSPDVIITSSTYPLDTYAGQRIKKYCKKSTTLIHEIHDMWPITPIEIGGMSKKHPFIRILQKAEDSFCKKSDKIVSLLSHSYEYLQMHGMNIEKFVHIPNGIVEEEWKQKEELPNDLIKTLHDIKNNHKRIICFFGSHTISYALEHIIEAVKRMPTNEIALVMIGDGAYKKELEKLAIDSNNIYFIGRIKKTYIPKVLDLIDYIYIGALNNEMFRFGICMNKLYDAMMSGKPIVYAVNAPNNYIKDYSCGISVEAESIDELEKAIIYLNTLTQEQINEMGINGRKAVLENFTTNVLATEFSKLF